MLCGRALPLLVFGLLFGVQSELLADGLRSLPRPLPLMAGLGLLNRLLTVVFLAMVLTIYALRRPATRSDHAPGAVIVTFVGTFFLFAVRFLPGGGPPGVLVLLLGDALLLGGLLFSLYSLAALRLSFSLVPEARRLVTTGPYRWVRHPLYLGETASGLGLILPALSPLTLAVFGIYLAAQLSRMHWEDQLLRVQFPDYGAWERRTWRFIPFVY